jgi:hypothetical protein
MLDAVVYFAAPYRLPSPDELGHAVVVLDLGFCADQGARRFETVTQPFIEGLGPRLKLWIDHHTHERHVDYAHDARFVLVPRELHPACPELVTPARVEAAGPVDTIVCHSDFDGIASAAKFLLGGREPYPGCDADARAIDSRVGTAGARALRLASALAVRHDEPMLRMVLKSLTTPQEPPAVASAIDDAQTKYHARVQRTEQQVAAGEYVGAAWVVDARKTTRKLDRTHALLMAQKRAVYGLFLGDDGRLSLATPMQTNVDLPTVFGTRGGMRNRITLPMKRLAEVLAFVEAQG